MMMIIIIINAKIKVTLSQ